MIKLIKEKDNAVTINCYNTIKNFNIKVLSYNYKSTAVFNSNNYRYEFFINSLILFIRKSNIKINDLLENKDIKKRIKDYNINISNIYIAVKKFYK